MKIGLHYGTYGDISVLTHILSNSPFDKDKDKFIFYYNGDEYIFSRSVSILDELNCDIKIKLFTTFTEWKTFKGFDKLIQTQVVENYFEKNTELQEYLDAGNICLSSASISFDHPNFHYNPFFNLIFFYYHYGYNFVNYYKFNKKENLLGVYHKPVEGISNGKAQRNYLYLKIKEILNDDLVSYASSDYNLKLLLQPYDKFGHWGNNHITSYIDFTTSVCNVVFETLNANAHFEDDAIGTNSYSRQYITEKTLKALLFSEENIFFIWYGPTKLYKHLMDMGFWFLNSEFYDESIRIPRNYQLPGYSYMEQSVVDTSNYLKSLKEEYKTNEDVHQHLMEKYGHKLEKNVELFKEILNSYSKKDEVINLIKNGKRD
jgi:hypothetical protein